MLNIDYISLHYLTDLDADMLCYVVLTICYVNIIDKIKVTRL